MNIEELSKSQLILLTILVNFVMSVATGILTVSLLDHAPAYVMQTVNRVVEHTIETVAAAAPASIIQAAPAPSNQDLVTTAIGAAASRAVAIYDAQMGTSTPPLSIGTYLSKSRSVVTVAQDVLPRAVLIHFTNDTYVPATLTHEGKGIAIYGFSSSVTLPKTTSPMLIARGDLKLGATALALGSDGSASTGIVSRVSEKGIQTTLPDIGAGSGGVDIAGNLIGIGAGENAGFLISTNVISGLLSATTTSATSTTISK